MARHTHDERVYETSQVVDEETGERATYTGCAECGALLDDPHGVAPTEED